MINNKSRSQLLIIFSIALMLIVTLTVVYAALSATLQINGNAQVQASSWDIRIKNADSAVYKNNSTGSATFTQPIINGTTIANYSVTLTKPGDSVTLYFSVKNTGSINAEIASIINSTPTCTSQTGTTTDADLVCDNLEVKFSYMDNKNISAGDVLNTIYSATCKNDGTQIIDTMLKVQISLNSNMTSVPSSKVTISNLSHEIIYTQSNKECIISESGGGNSPS